MAQDRKRTNLTLRGAMTIVKIRSVIRQRYLAHYQHCIPPFVIRVTSFPTNPTNLTFKTMHNMTLNKGLHVYLML